MNRNTFNSYINNADFSGLFISELGWNNPVGPTQLPPIEIDNFNFRPRIIAQRNAYQVLVCDVNAIPSPSICRRLDIKLRQYANDYILIFVHQSEPAHHLWLAPVKKVDKRDVVTTEYTSASQAEFIFQKIDNLTFSFSEATTISDVRERVQDSFAVNSERITKDFYAGFKKEHKAFAEFIKGIDGDSELARHDRQWYTSVMLNRLMFCYFIQKKGFLNGEVNYLRNRFNAHIAGEANGTFFRSFYLDFLRSLFTNGLNDPIHSREFENRFGKIPYLNGGMFDTHKIERDYADLDIDDRAFERLFAFFDKWNWHLDTRITASGKDINPDVLGYIFEQYINDRAQMGAYYTKEDITEYIGRNCILPFLFDKTRNANDYKAEMAEAFAPGGYVWQTLRESGDKYIFDAVKHGLNKFDEIPDEIRRGIITDEMRHEYAELPLGELPETHIPLSELRSEWNKRTPEQWGLPTEIWRETIERLNRAREIKAKIAAGEITDINDFITYNLDIRQFAQDLLAKADRKFVANFYNALLGVSILDPTCGSGAFLFAALNILEPLYEICIDRMQDFNRENRNWFAREVADIANHYRSNIQYFIFKSIILRNLYGVDIMVEATEIAKLRLFLKMVAVVEVDPRAENMGLDPLPDIDFNIRCGNTLVGYATEAELQRDLSNPKDFLEELANQDFKAAIELELTKAKDAYDVFRETQLSHGDNMTAFKQAKENLNQRLQSLNEQLNQRLFSATGTGTYDKWLASHQPFHWIAEYYAIIQGNGGFDVIIGNPPYVEYAKKNKETGKAIRDIYPLSSYDTLSCSNLFAFVIERSTLLSSNRNNIGFIVPLSLASNNNMMDLRKLLCKSGTNWFSHYEVRPAKLFDGAEQRLTILLMRNTNNCEIFSTSIIRWHNEHRNILFNSITYAPSFFSNTIWRTSSVIEESIYAKFVKHPAAHNQLSEKGSPLYYRTAGVRYWIIFNNEGFGTESLSNKVAYYSDSRKAAFYMAAFNSNLFWWYYALNYDMFNLKDYMIFSFRLAYDAASELSLVAKRLEDDMDAKKIEQVINSKTRGIVSTSYYQKKHSKPIIDEIDKVLAHHYSFTEEELDFIINYDIKYRMGDELNSDE